MKIKLFLILTLISFCGTWNLLGQDYDRAIGIRVGTANGISYKQFVGNTVAVEGLFVYRRGGTRVTGLVEQHFFFGSSSSLYIGLGGHAGYNGWVVEGGAARPAVGVDAELGFEYVFPHSPISFGIHMKPMVELYKGTVFSGNNAGLTLRMVY